MFYITGDTHRDFSRIITFCQENNTSLDDSLIITGDAGINYYCDYRDEEVLEQLSRLPINLLCVHGNHEARPYSLTIYKEQEKYGVYVLQHDRYKNIMFLYDCEVYNFDGIEAIVIGGAYSVDKQYRILRGYNWWTDEQPSKGTKNEFVDVCDELRWSIDCVLSHTCPLKYEPIETFMPGIDQRKVDKSTEEWLDSLEDRLDYKKWYCGHYHTDKSIDKMRFLFNDIIKFTK